MNKQNTLKYINPTILSVLVIYPLILVVLGGFYIKKYGLGMFEIGLFLLGYYFSQIIVCLAMHRLWSHRSFKTNKFVEFILALFAAGLLQGSTLAWVSMHYLHHRFTDTEKDPHSPLKYNSKIIGFFWSHVGWLFKGRDELKSYNHIEQAVIARLGKNKILMWQYKYYFLIALFMNTLVPSLVGYFCGNFEVIPFP